MHITGRLETADGNIIVKVFMHVSSILAAAGLGLESTPFIRVSLITRGLHH